MKTSVAGSVYYGEYESPVGPLLLTLKNDALTGLWLPLGKGRPAVRPHWRQDAGTGAFAAVCAQLEEYFAGTRRAFDLPLAPEGTAFQRSVWEALLKIPFGETVCYGELAIRLGNPKAMRAVGLANGRNPVSIIIPCHRVIGKSGGLTGYGGGLETKRRLLEHEAAVRGGPLL